MRATLLAGGLAALALPLLAGASAPQVGAAIAVRNQVTIASAGATARARVSSPVRAGDRIATARDSAIRVQLSDQTLFSLGANASASVDDFVFDEQANSSSFLISFLQGAFRYVSGTAGHGAPGQSKLVTPTATIGIRGTVVNGIIGPEALGFHRRADPKYRSEDGGAEEATLIVLTDAGGEHGGVDVTGRDGSVTRLRKAGESLFFRRRGMAPEPPRILPATLRAEIARRGAPSGLGREPARGGRGDERGGREGVRGERRAPERQNDGPLGKIGNELPPR